MDASGGGGFILVEPSSPDAMSGRIAGVATGTPAARAALDEVTAAAFDCQEASCQEGTGVGIAPATWSRLRLNQRRSIRASRDNGCYDRLERRTR